MTPEAQHWQQFIQSLTDRRQEIVRKANLPTTSHRDAHDLLCAVPGYDFAISLAIEYRNAAESYRLEMICQSAHDRLLRGDTEKELLAILEDAWKGRGVSVEERRARTSNPSLHRMAHETTLRDLERRCRNAEKLLDECNLILAANGLYPSTQKRVSAHLAAAAQEDGK